MCKGIFYFKQPSGQITKLLFYVYFILSLQKGKLVKCLEQEEEQKQLK